MSLWRQLTRGFRALINRTGVDQDLDDEVQHYFDQATDAWIARGLSPEEARRAARREFGSMTAVREHVRRYGWENTVGAVFADLRYAARGLCAAPGFTAISVLTLALGIGGTTAIFSAVNPILFEPLPYPASGRIAMILEVRSDGLRNPGTFGMYREFAERNRSFDAIAVLKPWQPTMTGADQPERFDAQRVSAMIEQGLAWHIVSEDFDLLVEYLMCAECVGLGMSPHARFARHLIQRTWTDMQFLPGPTFDPKSYREKAGAAADAYAVEHMYHTNFLWGMCCAVGLLNPTEHSRCEPIDE